MDGIINFKTEKQTIYEIYRACRLCGAGAGYKMPIIQNIVSMDDTEVELKQKIRDCVQIEVHQDDKMPPLICELCVDKVNDFYEFLEMCRQTNKRTRLRLGLPPQTLPRGAPDAGDCILGVTEPIFVGSEDSNEPILKSKGKNAKSSKGKKVFHIKDGKNKANVPQKKEIKKEGVKIKIEPRTLRSKAPSPLRLRGTKRPHEDDISPNRLQKARKPEQHQPRSILKRNSVNSDSKSEDSSRLKGLREKDKPKEFKEKKVKIVVKPPPPRATKSSKPASTKRSQWKCNVCRTVFNSNLSLSNHMRKHVRSKHAEHKTPSKRPSQPRKLECKTCKREFPHKNMLDIHRCSAKPAKPSRPVAVQKPVSKPQRTLPSRRKSIDPKLLKHLRPFQVRTARCDPLLEQRTGEHYDVSNVNYDFGLDKKCVYPYISSFRNLRIKSEPGYMVNIQDEIKDVFDLDENYVHWDSEDETDSDLEFTVMKKVDSLTSLTLKTIFSNKLLGKVPKKRRKIKVDKAFDSILNASEDEPDIRKDIHNIIDSLDDDKDNKIKSTEAKDSVVTNDKIDKSHDDNDSLFGDDKTPAVTNDDFDSLFNSKEDLHINKFDTIDAKSKASKDTNISNKAECNNKVNGEISTNDINSEKTALSLSDNYTTKNTESLDNSLIDEHSDSDSKSILSNDAVRREKNDDSLVLETKNDKHTKDNHECTNNSKKVDVSEDVKSIHTDEKAYDSKIGCIDNIKLDDNPNRIEGIEGNDKLNENTNANTAKSDKISIESNTIVQNVGNDCVTDSIRSDKNNADNHAEVDDSRKMNENSVTDSIISDKNIADNHPEVDLRKVNENCATDSMRSDKDIADKHEEVEDSRTQEVDKDSEIDTAVGLNDNETPLASNGQLDLDVAFNMDDLEDVSDTEIEDRHLMEALDAQIYDSVTDVKSVCDRDIVLPDDIIGSMKPTDLESISDGEFD